MALPRAAVKPIRASQASPKPAPDEPTARYDSWAAAPVDPAAPAPAAALDAPRSAAKVASADIDDRPVSDAALDDAPPSSVNATARMAVYLGIAAVALLLGFVALAMTRPG